MNRRHFIRNSSLLSASVMTPGLIQSALSMSPYTSGQVEHVILCIAGGGIRNSESIHRQYGNLMPGLFEGEMSDLLPTPLRNELSAYEPLSKFGTVFRNFSYNGYAAGHKLAMQAILNGYYPKEENTGKTNWEHSNLFKNTKGKKILITSNRPFLTSETPSTSNDFTHILFPGKGTQNFKNHLEIAYEDLQIGHYASMHLEEKTPTLMGVHFFGADACHSSFSRYAENLGAMSLAIRKIWKTVQLNPILNNRTAMVVIPDFGRNTIPNSLLDEQGNSCFDHTITDPQTREIFCLIAGPENCIGQNVVSSQYGESKDIPCIVKQMLSEIKLRLF